MLARIVERQFAMARVVGISRLKMGSMGIGQARLSH